MNRSTMNFVRLMTLLVFLAAVLTCGVNTAQEATFYKNPQGLFTTRPSEKTSVQTLARLGPVGMGIDLVQPAFTMKIKNIEEGSPSAAVATLKPGQIIESINGQKLADIDPRMQLGQILAAAEASDGVLRLMIVEKTGDVAQEVVVKIPILGAYSETWPLHCPKSDKIIRGFADYLTQPDSHKGFSGIGMLFLLSTDEEKDLAVVRKWARGLRSSSGYAWHIGFGGIPLTEYYLRTGDEQVLPTIQNWVDAAVKGQYLGGWAGRGGVAGVTYGGGGGHLNAGGTAVVTFLLLAKECGAEVPEHTLQSALTHFFRYAGRGSNPYGDNKPETGFVDNGKNGNLAFAMAAAAALTPDGENSVYANARDTCAMTSFYTTTYMLHGHTGGGIGEIWRSAAMGLLYDKRPQQYREFMDNRQWHYDLSRRWDGSFGILGGARYDNLEWGAGYPLAYTIPRKTLRITGAPPTKFSKQYQLPERPWGTPADDAFLSLEAATDKDGKRQDVVQETLANDSGLHLLPRIMDSKVSDKTLRLFAHHQDYLIRLFAARKALGMNTNYLGRGGGGGAIHSELVHELLASPDPRVRGAAIEAVAGRLTGNELEKFLTPREFQMLLDTLEDPAESWWLKGAALRVVSRLPADKMISHVDTLTDYLAHEEWWLQHDALIALTPLVADPRCYQKVLPAIGELLRTCQRYNVTAGPLRGIRNNLKSGSAEVQQLAIETLKHSYQDYAGVNQAPGGQDISTTYESQMRFIAQSLADVPGGYDFLYDLGKARFPNDPLPYASIFLSADPENFGPELKQAIGPIIREKLIYQYIGENRLRLREQANHIKQSSYPTSQIDGLTDLYRKVGIHDYDWHEFGPNLKDANWHYHTFDPAEEQKYDLSPWRYREVTYPAGMEDWFAPKFDPSQTGWATGQAPFGQHDGKLVTDSRPCGNPNCRHADPMQTLWEDEVLLVRGTFKFPPLQPGHLYRIRVGTGQHVGSGDGYRIYINGQELIETKEGVGRRMGARPRGAFITNEFIDQFNQGEVTIAATSFLRYGSRASVSMPPVPQGIFSLWVEEMKIPPLDNDALQKSAAVVPLRSMEWQENQDSENMETQSENHLYFWDGNFVNNSELHGTWKVIHQLKSDVAFDPSATKLNPGRPPVATITFRDQGKTDDPFWIWSGDTLMDLRKNEALKMILQTIDGTDYLFVQGGGFSERNPPDWQTPVFVFTK